MFSSIYRADFAWERLELKLFEIESKNSIFLISLLKVGAPKTNI